MHVFIFEIASSQARMQWETKKAGNGRHNIFLLNFSHKIIVEQNHRHLQCQQRAKKTQAVQCFPFKKWFRQDRGRPAPCNRLGHRAKKIPHIIFLEKFSSQSSHRPPPPSEGGPIEKWLKDEPSRSIYCTVRQIREIRRRFSAWTERDDYFVCNSIGCPVHDDLKLLYKQAIVSFSALVRRLCNSCKTVFWI